jgi:hypothetical protein
MGDFDLTLRILNNQFIACIQIEVHSFVLISNLFSTNTIFLLVPRFLFREARVNKVHMASDFFAMRRVCARTVLSSNRYQLIVVSAITGAHGVTRPTSKSPLSAVCFSSPCGTYFLGAGSRHKYAGLLSVVLPGLSLCLCDLVINPRNPRLLPHFCN